ncbi:MAG: DUF4203 domain-containing protein [Acidobacteriota bacterium]
MRFFTLVASADLPPALRALDPSLALEAAEDIAAQLTGHASTAHLLLLVTGLLLLIFGRRLYWLALAAVGMVLGIGLATRLQLGDPGLVLGVAFLLGVVGAVATIAAQRIAIGLGGMLFGMYAAMQIFEMFRPDHNLDPKIWILMMFAAGILGILLANRLFEAALVVLTAGLGAALAAEALGAGAALDYPWPVAIFAVLFAFGLFTQWRAGRRQLRVPMRLDDQRRGDELGGTLRRR